MNKDRIQLSKVVQGLAILILVGLGFYFLTFLPKTRVGPEHYSVVGYPISKSPIYNQLPEICFDDYWSSAQDYRLVKDNGVVVIPSLIQKISGIQDWKYDCNTVISLFSNLNSKYIYLQIIFLVENDASRPPFDAILQLDLADLQIKKLEISKLVSDYDFWSSPKSYVLLPDGFRLLKFNMDKIYLVNLEEDSYKEIYSAPKDQWIISEFDVSENIVNSYDFNIKDNKIILGLYDQTKTEDGYSMEVEGHVSVFGKSANREGLIIKPKFLEYITLDIPE